MTIDHIGLFFFPEIVVFRMVGRLALPLFGWLIANGAYHTRNIRAYLLRLIIFALITRLVLIFSAGYTDLLLDGFNILGTLALGLIAIIVLKQTNNWYLRASAIVVCAIAAAASNSDYGAAGVLVVVSSYIFFNNLKLMALVHMTIYLSFYTYPMIIKYTQDAGYQPNGVELYQFLGILAIIIFWMYNGTEGRKMKYWFYIYYPAHFLVIYHIYYFI